MKIKRKLTSVILVCLLALVLLVGSITGCKKNEEVRRTEKKEVVLWHYWDLPHQRKKLRELINVFNETREDMIITTRYIPDADFRKELALNITDRKAPEIALVDSADFHYFNSMKSFVDLTDKVEELKEYLPEALEPCTVDGKVLGMPCGLNCTALFYNKEMFRKSGIEIPDTWAEFCDAARKLTVDVDSINSEESLRAFHLLKELAQSGAMNRQSISLTGTDLAGQFAHGNVAMMLNGIMRTDYIVKQDLCDKDRMTSYIEDLDLLAPGKDFMEQQFMNAPVQRQFIDILQTASPREFNEEWPEISSVISEAIEAVIVGNSSEEEVLYESAARIQEIREKRR